MTGALRKMLKMQAYICAQAAAESFKSSIHDRVKLKPGPTEIIHHRLPIRDFIKLS